MVGETVGSLGYLPICTLLFEQLIIKPALAAARVSSDIEPKWHHQQNYNFLFNFSPLASTFVLANKLARHYKNNKSDKTTSHRSRYFMWSEKLC